MATKKTDNRPQPADWRRMRFKHNKVWVALDASARPLERKGRVLIKYRLDQDYEYWVHPRNLRPLDEPQPPAAENSQPAAPSAAARRAAPGRPTAVDVPAEAVCIYTDGAASGNPGPAGIGILLHHPAGVEEISRSIGIATNNQAELEAIRTGLLAVKDREQPVRLFTDSQYAFGVLTLGWKPKKNRPLIEAIQRIMAGFRDLQLFKVRGHAGHPENERADALATAAIRQSR
jgi:ribonuclease HI